MFRIGEFAHLSGVNAKTLRNYDVRGIFHPAWVDPQSRYRYYSPAQLPDLRRLIALRDLGIPLAEVARLAAGGADLRAVLERRRARLEAERARIDAKMVALDIRVEMEDAGPDVVVRTVPSQLVAVLGVSATDRIEDRFYLLESVVRDARARASLPPGMLAPRDRANGVEIFVPITRTLSQGEVSSRRLPVARMATAIHRGPYSEMPTVHRALQQWVTAAGWAADGPLRILYLQFGAEPELGVPAAYLADRPGDFVTEIQIPVTSAS